MTSFTVEQLQTKFDQAIDFVQTGKSLTITQDGQPTAILFSFKEGSELLRLRHITRLDGGYYAKRVVSLAESVPELSMDGHDATKSISQFGYDRGFGRIG